MPERLTIIALINSDQFLIGSELKLILAVRISAADLMNKTQDPSHYLVLASGSVAAGVVGALDLGGVTELAPPARTADTSVAASLQLRDERSEVLVVQ